MYIPRYKERKGGKDLEKRSNKPTIKYTLYNE